MNMHKTLSAAAIIVLFGAVSGCAVFDKCSPENCSTDAQTTKDVGATLDHHHEFGPPGTVRVQTINGVVYLSGQVNSDFEVRNAEAIARQSPNVKDVVNNLNPRSNAR